MKRNKLGQFSGDKSTKPTFCVECNKRISWRSKKCRSCAVKYAHKHNKNMNPVKLVGIKSRNIRKKLREQKIGEKNPMYNKSPSNITRLKISKKLKRAYKEGRKNIWSKGKKIPLSTKIKSSCKQRGISIKDWDGFGKDEFYPFIFYKTRIQIVNRDNNRCVICGKNPRKIHIHHINYNKQDNSNKNLISLCDSCHGKTNGRRKYWEWQLSIYSKLFC